MPPGQVGQADQITSFTGNASGSPQEVAGQGEASVFRL